MKRTRCSTIRASVQIRSVRPRGRGPSYSAGAAAPMGALAVLTSEISSRAFLAAVSEAWRQHARPQSERSDQGNDINVTIACVYGSGQRQQAADPIQRLEQCDTCGGTGPGRYLSGNMRRMRRERAGEGQQRTTIGVIQTTRTCTRCSGKAGSSKSRATAAAAWGACAGAGRWRFPFRRASRRADVCTARAG